MVKSHQTIIDVGFGFVDGKMFTDVDHKHVDEAVTAITPRIGGVGPLTIFHLLDNMKVLSGM
jgi:5,10-methylene-tetrahydrofolate dehydrogenase/methenyl tetrahydrofolate cyclohydrolase